MSVPQKLFLALAAATAANFLALALWVAPAIEAEAGGRRIFDARLAYDAEAAFEFLGALSPAGAALYLDPYRLLDTAFPALLALTLLIAIGRLTRDWPLALRRALLAPPLLGAVFDLMENRSVAAMIRAGAEATTADMVSTASLWTTLKWIADGLSALIVLALIAAAAVSRRR